LHKAIYHFEGHQNSHSQCKYTIDRQEHYLASGDEDGAIRIWSLNHSLPIKTIHLSQEELATTLSRPLFMYLENHSFLCIPSGKTLSFFHIT
jgi:WD40 repeat protein